MARSFSDVIGCKKLSWGVKSLRVPQKEGGLGTVLAIHQKRDAVSIAWRSVAGGSLYYCILLEKGFLSHLLQYTVILQQYYYCILLCYCWLINRQRKQRASGHPTAKSGRPTSGAAAPHLGT